MSDDESRVGTSAFRRVINKLKSQNKSEEEDNSIDPYKDTHSGSFYTYQRTNRLINRTPPPSTYNPDDSPHTNDILSKYPNIFDKD